MKQTSDLYVPISSANAYEEHTEEMLEMLNPRMVILAKEKQLIGNSPVSVMLDNHRNHIKFMTNVFKLNDYEMLKKTIVWVVQSYQQRGFHAEYFPEVCKQWIEVIDNTFGGSASNEIVEVYQWMIDYIEEPKENPLNKTWDDYYPYDNQSEKRVGEFTAALLKGDSIGALSLAKKYVASKKDIAEFYTKIVTHAMYSVGKQWERGSISVAHEHLASSIVLRIMSALYMEVMDSKVSKGKIVVTATDNEHHEIGARIIADFLELDGWEVTYLGSNVPEEDLLKTIREINPMVVCFSVTMVFNIERAKSIIEEVKAQNKDSDIKVVVGGYAFSRATIDDGKLGADEIILDGDTLIRYSNMIWENA